MRLRTFKSSSTLTCGLDGYAKVTESKIMSAAAEISGSFMPDVVGFGASMTAKKSVAAPIECQFQAPGLGERRRRSRIYQLRCL